MSASRRRSQRLSTGDSTESKHKRAASGSGPASQVTKKPKKQLSTPKKSQYFEPDSEADELAEDDSPSPVENDSSEFGEDAAVSEASDSPEDDEDEYDSHADSAPKKRRMSAKSTPNSVRAPAGENYKPGVTIIKKPKARPAGNVKYADETIHPNTLLFLKDLKANNNRPWLKLHDADFRQAEKDWHTFVEKMTETLSEIDDTVFRIYRDVRFSSDPTPYKPFFSAAWSRAGRKSPYAHYYVQIGPTGKGDSFVGGGLWCPEAAATAAMRRAIDRNSARLKGVLADEAMRKHFLGGSKTDAKALKAFVEGNKSNALKTKPKGYDGDHPDIELLRLRNYTVGKKIPSEELLGEDGAKRVAELLATLKPMITYCNSVVMPDEAEGEEEDESGDDEDGDEEEASD
ncbi:unnamed protein product [Zymoseptoria tritici ST99CH_3D1]|nr:unnamed protein product [Zymoseptoria tritici ST99CH_3D1]